MEYPLPLNYEFAPSSVSLFTPASLEQFKVSKICTKFLKWGKCPKHVHLPTKDCFLRSLFVLVIDLINGTCTRINVINITRILGYTSLEIIIYQSHTQACQTFLKYLATLDILTNCFLAMLHQGREIILLCIHTRICCLL